MDAELMLPVEYKGKEYEFPFKVVLQGYAPRYVVLVDELEVIFERDDQGELRAIVYNQEGLTASLPAHGLLEVISATIQQLTS